MVPGTLLHAASYTEDGITDRAFGRFTEVFSGDTLTYKDLESGTTFTLNLNTGKKVQ